MAGQVLAADLDPRAFRDVLGQLPTGVVVVTALTEEGPVGMSCNSFTSVSIAPPLVSFCPALTSTTWPLIERAGRFCVNVLSSPQSDVCGLMSRKDIDRFASTPWHPRPGGPGLDGARAWIDCEIESLHAAGDHLICVGAVLALEAAPDEAEPLVFWRGAYGSFAAHEAEVSA